MTKTDTQLHRWALLDKNGKTRGTLTSPSKGDATRAFGIQRGRVLPHGYLVVDRGPVEAPALRPFQVGDLVELTVNTDSYPSGTRASVMQVRKFSIHTDVMGIWSIPFGVDMLRLVEPTPQPKAGEHILSGMVDRFLGWKLPQDFMPDGGISFDPSRLGSPRLTPSGTNLFHAGQAKAMLEHVAGPALAESQRAVDSINEILIKHQGMLHDARQEIATLKAEVERLGCELADAGERVAKLSKDRDGWVNEADLWKRRWKDLESKLDDIQALHRVMSLAKASPVDEWDFTTLLADVLNR